MISDNVFLFSGHFKEMLDRAPTHFAPQQAQLVL
jgi:hypothetical protein